MKWDGARRGWEKRHCKMDQHVAVPSYISLMAHWARTTLSKGGCISLCLCKQIVCSMGWNLPPKSGCESCKKAIAASSNLIKIPSGWKNEMWKSSLLTMQTPRQFALSRTCVKYVKKREYKTWKYHLFHVIWRSRPIIWWRSACTLCEQWAVASLYC